MPLDLSRSEIAATIQRVLARIRSLFVTAWNRPLEAWASRQVAAGRHGARTLASVVRHAELERLRQVIDTAIRDGASPSQSGRGTAQEAANPRLPTDAAGLPTGSLAVDAAFAQAVLMASYATATASAALERTSRRASRRMVRAGIERLTRERRYDLAWQLIRMRTDVRVEMAQLASVISGGTSRADLESLGDDAASVLPWLDGRNRVVVGALAAVESGRRAFEIGLYSEADAWFTRVIAIDSTLDVLVWSARAAVMVGDLERASDLVNRVVAERDAPASAWRVKARLHELAGEDDQALRSWLEVARKESAIESDLVAAYEGLGRLGNLEAKTEVSARLVDRTGERPDAVARHAAVLWECGAVPRAEQMVDKYTDASDAPSLRASALYLGRTGRSPEAYDILSRMSIFTRGPEATAELIRGLCNDGHCRLAAQARDRALGVFSEGAAAHRIRAATDPVW